MYYLFLDGHTAGFNGREYVYVLPLCADILSTLRQCVKYAAAAPGKPDYLKWFWAFGTWLTDTAYDELFELPGPHNCPCLVRGVPVYVEGTPVCALGENALQFLFENNARVDCRMIEIGRDGTIQWMCLVEGESAQVQTIEVSFSTLEAVFEDLHRRD